MSTPPELDPEACGAAVAPRRRGPRRDERGTTLIDVVATLATVAALSGYAAAAAADEPATAEARSAACALDERQVRTAIESYREVTDAYPQPAGDDGLDAVRDEGLLASTSVMWVYTGLDDHRRPSVSPADICA